MGIRGHAVAETPTVVARALLYIVRASPSFLLDSSINHSIIPFINFPVKIGDCLAWASAVRKFFVEVGLPRKTMEWFFASEGGAMALYKRKGVCSVEVSI